MNYDSLEVFFRATQKRLHENIENGICSHGTVWTLFIARIFTHSETHTRAQFTRTRAHSTGVLPMTPFADNKKGLYIFNEPASQQRGMPPWYYRGWSLVQNMFS